MSDYLSSQRASGILAHLTSLPNPHGIGDLGISARSFIDFLARAGQKYWQILPTGPTSLVFDSSPYMSSSAFAGSPLFISLASLVDQGMLEKKDIETTTEFSPYNTDYNKVVNFKKPLLAQAFREFIASPDQKFLDFIAQTDWLRDYALFMALKEAHSGSAWYDWPAPLARKNNDALAPLEEKYLDRIRYYQFEQYLFYQQWQKMRQYAHENNIRIIGDIPIYVALDSADVWSNQRLFEIDETTLKPQRVSGVPPDYFSKNGQRWGNPLYRWNSHDKWVREGLVLWWAARFKAMFNLVDVARIDHFRGFESYWAVPEEEETALNGTWQRGPGADFFNKIKSRLGTLNIIAEDLGDITPAVIELRDKLGFPGMKVLQFAFDGNPDNPFLPYNFKNPNCVVYTGTHDNDTSLGWFLSERIDDNTRSRIKRTANRVMHDQSAIHEDLIYLALSSTANLAVIPLQDLLGFGSDCRMNTPGEPEGNWRWRCAEEFLTEERAGWLKSVTELFGR